MGRQGGDVMPCGGGWSDNQTNGKRGNHDFDDDGINECGQDESGG